MPRPDRLPHTLGEQVTKFDWSKAKKRPGKSERLAHQQRHDPALSQRAYREFVTRHHLTCFKCGSPPPLEWAKVGTNKNGHWAICTTCVKRP